MSDDQLTNSERYVKKTNTIILIIGLSSLLIFIFGLILLMSSGDDENLYEEPVFTDNADVFGAEKVQNVEPAQGIEFSTIESEIPLTATPDPIPMGEVVLGTEAKNVLTLGTNGKAAIKIASVELADPPAAGFVFSDKCSGETLNGKDTCHITMSWNPVVAGNVQNNFIISWHEVNLGSESMKSAKVPVSGNAVNKEECRYCESSTSKAEDADYGKALQAAIGPDGKKIGVIDKDGYVRDENGNIIGKVSADGLILDKDGNVIGVAENSKTVYDEFSNPVGYVTPDGEVINDDGKVIGKVLPDGTALDFNGNSIGSTTDIGAVYDANGNLIGRALPDGTVVDKDGNVIGRVLPDGSVVDKDGTNIGSIAKTGRTVIDGDGKVMGVTLPTGEVVNADGEIIGKVDDNGAVVAADSPLMGKTLKVAYDKNGNVIGYVDKDGNLLNVKGEVIGKMREDGKITNLKGDIIGYAGEEIVFNSSKIAK